MSGDIDRWSETPYKEQLAAIIRAQIQAGQIPAVETEGEPEPVRWLPSEKYLMERYRVSRSTVRGALEVLRDGGWIETHRRRGSRVRRDLPRP